MRSAFQEGSSSLHISDNVEQPYFDQQADSGGLARSLDLAVQVLGEWRTFGRSPRDAFAKIVPSEMTPAQRADLAAVAYGTIRDERRLEYALGGIRGLMFGGAARDAALLLAYRVASGELAPEAADQRFVAWSPGRLPFFAVLRLDRAIDTIRDPVERFALRHSMPDWLARLLLTFGESADLLGNALRSDAPRVIRANLLRGSREDLRGMLTAAKVASAPCELAPHGLAVLDFAPLFSLSTYHLGWFEQQDEGSQLIAEFTAPPPRGKVLDACAGSGGKTLALAALLQNRGTVLACDVHERRLADLKPRAARAGAQNVQWALVGEDSWPEPVQQFARAADRILLDVPCSGIGAWRRRPEARWTIKPTDLESLERIQAELIDRAALLLRPGARIVYSTCTLLRGENEAQIEAALLRHPHLEVVRAREILGGALADRVADATGTYLSLRPDVHDTDGFFAAVLRCKRG
jgi:16S rRNA (cytosine967-C5)-methyltransferase